MSQRHYFLFSPPSFKFSFIFVLQSLVLCLHVCLCEGVGYSGAGVTDRCELPCGCWELNPGLLEEQSVLLTTEPPLQPLVFFFFLLLFF